MASTMLEHDNNGGADMFTTTIRPTIKFPDGTVLAHKVTVIDPTAPKATLSNV